MTTIDDLLTEQCEISWVLFEHVRPLIEAHINRSRLPRISTSRDAELAQKITEIIEEALPVWYRVQELFIDKINPVSENQLQHAVCSSKLDFYTQYRTLVENILRRNGKGLTPEAREVLQRTTDFDAVQAGINLQKQYHLRMRYGSSLITPDPRYPVVMQVSRIKNPKSFAEKFARYVCEGLIESPQIMGAFEIGVWPQIPHKIRETFASMHTLGFMTPFDLTEQGFDTMEYLLVRSWVRDTLGTTYVTRKREEAVQLSREMLSSGKKDQYNPKRVEVVRGHELIHYGGSWRFAEAHLVDNRIQRGSLQLGSAANRNIFLYATMPKTHHVADVGFSSCDDYGEDRIGGKGSHDVYEARKQAEIRGRPRELRVLYTQITTAVERIMTQVPISDIPFDKVGSK
jgi:hypothetical protein